MLSEIEGNEVGGNAAHRTRAQPWTPEARNYVEALQERHYRKLSGLLGLGNDPKAAYRQLSRGTMTGEDLNIDKMKDKSHPICPKRNWLGRIGGASNLGSTTLSIPRPPKKIQTGTGAWQ